jgi:lipoprotein
MNTKIKQLTLLATAGFLLAACGQGKKEESTQATTQAQTTQAQTTQATTQAQATTTAPTQTTKAAQSDANEVKTVYQLVNTNVTTKLTLYSKGNIIERTITEVITDFSVDNVPEASREAVKQSYEIQKSVLEQTYGDLKNKITELKGFKFDSKKEGDKYIQTYETDYTIVDREKLKSAYPPVVSFDDPTNLAKVKENLVQMGFKEVQ